MTNSMTDCCSKIILLQISTVPMLTKRYVFDCEDCGKPLVQLSKWRLHNKSFTAEFSCKYCRKKFNGRVSFKKKFDEVSVKKKLNEKVEKKPEIKEQVNTVSAN